MKLPAYDLRAAKRADVLALFVENHGYKSLSATATYLFAVYEDGKPIAAFAWQPPPPGSAKSVCPEAPQGVLSLSPAWSLSTVLTDASSTSRNHCDVRCRT